MAKARGLQRYHLLARPEFSQLSTYWIAFIQIFYWQCRRSNEKITESR